MDLKITIDETDIAAEMDERDLHLGKIIGQLGRRFDGISDFAGLVQRHCKEEANALADEGAEDLADFMNDLADLAGLYRIGERPERVALVLV